MAHNDSWLYRQGDLILGPLATKALVEKLYSGEVLGDTEVQVMGSGLFRRVSQVPELKVELAKAEAKLRIDAASAQHRQAQKKRTRLVLGIAAGTLTVVAVVMAGVGQYLAVHAGGGDDAAELNITVDAPTIGVARRGGDTEFVDYTGSGGTKRPTAVAARPSPGATVPGTTPAPGATGKTPRMGAADSEGMQMGEVDQDMINSVIAAHKKTLYPCLKAVAKPGVPMKVPLEFAIAETGKVTKVWVDNSDLKDTGVQECMYDALQKWPFKPGGSGTSVKLSFNVGR